MTTMDTHNIVLNTSIQPYDIDNDKAIDYGYEDHTPDVRNDADAVDVLNPELVIATSLSTNTFCIADRFTSISSHGKETTICDSRGGNNDASEVSQSPSQLGKVLWSRTTNDGNTIGAAVSTQEFDLEYDDDDDDDDDDDCSNSRSLNEENGIDFEEVIRATAKNVVGKNQLHDDATLMNDEYPPMPPDRQARKQRSFRRRGGELHGALLKSAVMASMSFDCDDSIDDDNDGERDTNEKYPMGRFRDINRESNHSSISLQSLQDALHSETSPRKRARRGQRRTSFDTDCENDDESEIKKATNDDTMEASDLFVNMRVGVFNGNGSFHRANRSSGNSRRSSSGTSNFRGSTNSSASDFSVNAAAAAADIVRDAPLRRVSRKKSYDSRASDYDSDFDSDEWDL